MGLSPGTTGREDWDRPTPSPFSACGAAAPSTSHPDATKAAWGRSISPFHGFPLELLDIPG